jgi:hypothetical protein
VQFVRSSILKAGGGNIHLMKLLYAQLHRNRQKAKDVAKGRGSRRAFQGNWIS